MYKEIFEDTKIKLKSFLVSVVIPFYNRNEEVCRAIKSVLDQTHRNIEIIIVNDGSTSDISKVHKIVNENKNIITLINLEKNKGASHARNVGLDIAKGDYVAFLDSDDEFCEEKIEQQLMNMLLRDSLLSHTSYIRRGFDSEQIIDSGKLTGDVRKRIIYNCTIATPTVMINRKYLETKKYRFNEELIIGEDTCFWLDLLENTELLGIDIPLSIVNSNYNSAAYNDEKQIIGLKTILTYVLNHNELNKYDYEIAILARCYSNYVDRLKGDKEVQINYEYDRNNSERIKRWIRTIIKSISENGIIVTLKKIYQRASIKLRRS
ncbi:MAG TPA: glycosyltransferase family A protein [Clostridia bacterium]|nr:glycosyltransferase family A protein [Clostridia bacterium]